MFGRGTLPALIGLRYDALSGKALGAGEGRAIFPAEIRG